MKKSYCAGGNKSCYQETGSDVAELPSQSTTGKTAMSGSQDKDIDLLLDEFVWRNGKWAQLVQRSDLSLNLIT